MKIFWREGYQGASLKALGDAMNLQPGSIYAAFGSKEALFREALATYVERVRTIAIASGLGAKPLIERWFSEHINAALDEDGAGTCGRGCLLLNSTVETAHVDEKTAQMVRAEVDTLERFLRACVVKARQGAPAALGPTATARLLVATLVGISALSRLGVSRRSLEDIARAAIDSV